MELEARKGSNYENPGSSFPTKGTKAEYPQIVKPMNPNQQKHRMLSRHSTLDS